MAAKEYVIVAVKKGRSWKGGYGDMQDYALALKGIGEPVKLTLPQPIIEDPEIGDRLYGKLYDEKSDDGRVYHKLKIEKRPEEDLRALDIHAQGGLKLAVEIWLNTSYETKEERMAAYNNIKSEAVHFADMINEIKKELL